MKALGHELEELLDWDEHLNGKKTNIQNRLTHFSIHVFFPHFQITTMESHLRPS
jgi:hypothetical protein